MTRLSYQNIHIHIEILYLLLVSAGLVHTEERCYMTGVPLFSSIYFIYPNWLQKDIEKLAVEASDNRGPFILFMNSI